VVCDAASTDRTPEVVLEKLGSIPGTLHQTEWRERGPSRTEALRLAKGKADYHLVLDAGTTLDVAGDYRSALEADSYLLRQTGPAECWVERLVSDRHDWDCVGAVHEYIRSRAASTRERLDGLTITPQEDETSRGERCREAIELLNTSIERGVNVPRSTFYLAQSYRDIGNLAQAVELYEKRTTMGGWEEEVWYSHYQVARLQQRMGVSWLLVLHKYLEAYQFRPSRIEPLHQIAKYYREAGQDRLAGLFAQAGAGAPYPDDLLYIERALYEGAARNHR
jgi:hypothetical protein